MTPEKNLSIAHKWFEAFNTHNLKKIQMKKIAFFLFLILISIVLINYKSEKKQDFTALTKNYRKVSCKF